MDTGVKLEVEVKLERGEQAENTEHVVYRSSRVVMRDATTQVTTATTTMLV